MTLLVAVQMQQLLIVQKLGASGHYRGSVVGVQFLSVEKFLTTDRAGPALADGQQVGDGVQSAETPFAAGIAFRLPAFAFREHPSPAAESGLPCGRLAATLRTTTGLPCPTCPSHDRVGRSLYSGGLVSVPDPIGCPVHCVAAQMLSHSLRDRSVPLGSAPTRRPGRRGVRDAIESAGAEFRGRSCPLVRTRRQFPSGRVGSAERQGTVPCPGAGQSKSEVRHVPRIACRAGLVLLVAAGFLAVAATPAKADRIERLKWVYEGGFFKDVGNGQWDEANTGGSYHFKEVGRNREFVELYDDSRDCSVRLYRHAMYLKGFNGQTPDWVKFYDGRWAE